MHRLPGRGFQDSCPQRRSQHRPMSPPLLSDVPGAPPCSLYSECPGRGWGFTVEPLAHTWSEVVFPQTCASRVSASEMTSRILPGVQSHGLRLSATLTLPPAPPLWALSLQTPRILPPLDHWPLSWAAGVTSRPRPQPQRPLQNTGQSLTWCSRAWLLPALFISCPSAPGLPCSHRTPWVLSRPAVPCALAGNLLWAILPTGL